MIHQTFYLISYQQNHAHIIKHSIIWYQLGKFNKPDIH